MATQITHNVEVSVHSKFESGHSNPSNHEYLYGYHIAIKNMSNSTIQLLSRHWFIFDSNGDFSEVKGEGVIGEQPILLPSQIHEYDSFCKLTTDFGKMWGTYLMKRTDDNELFEVKIPEFELITNSKLN